MTAPVVNLPGLVTGQRMNREEFLRRWEALPDLKNAELIEGVVYVASPVSKSHWKPDARVVWWLMQYETFTPGCEAGNNGTWYMLDSLPQPDAFLRLLPEAGGMSVDREGYPVGAPELAAEICVISADYDFGSKLALYQRAGVKEYITIETVAQRIVWRQLQQNGSYAEMPPGRDGIYRSVVFPGLWLDPAAFWAQDGPRLQEVLAQGLASAEHAEFVEELQRRKK